MYQAPSYTSSTCFLLQWNDNSAWRYNGHWLFQVLQLRQLICTWWRNLAVSFTYCAQNSIIFFFMMIKGTKCWNFYVDRFNNSKYKFFVKFCHVSYNKANFNANSSCSNNRKTKTNSVTIYAPSNRWLRPVFLLRFAPKCQFLVNSSQ